MKTKFTIERKNAGLDPKRYLMVTDNGDFGWGSAGTTFNMFETERAAERFRLFRLGEHASRAVVVPHAVH